MITIIILRVAKTVEIFEICMCLVGLKRLRQLKKVSILFVLMSP